MAREGRYSSSSSSSSSITKSRSRNKSRSKYPVRSTSRSRSRYTAGSRSRSRSSPRSRYSSTYGHSRSTLRVNLFDDSDDSNENNRSEDSSRYSSRFRFSRSTPISVNPFNDSDFIEDDGAEDSAEESKKNKSISEGVNYTKEQINNMTRVEIAQELDNAEEKRNILTDKQGGMKTRHAKECEELAKKQKDEVESLQKQIGKNKSKIMDLEKAMQSRLEFPRGPKVPECPACLEEMGPPTEIFSCSNGHLVCGECKPKVTDINADMCITCRTVKYMGRATAMEQMIREMFDI